MTTTDATYQPPATGLSGLDGSIAGVSFNLALEGDYYPDLEQDLGEDSQAEEQAERRLQCLMPELAAQVQQLLACMWPDRRVFVFGGRWIAGEKQACLYIYSDMIGGGLRQLWLPTVEQQEMAGGEGGADIFVRCYPASSEPAPPEVDGVVQADAAMQRELNAVAQAVISQVAAQVGGEWLLFTADPQGEMIEQTIGS